MGLRRSILAILLLLAWAGGVGANPALVRDLHVVARALPFAEGVSRVSGSASIAVVYNASNPVSASQMRDVLRALTDMEGAGDLVLLPSQVEQSQLGSARPYDAVVSLTGVDQSALARFLRSSGTPCFTFEEAQVSGGACAVAVRSSPTVAISLNSRNAADAGVRFATAFIMMVREI